MSRTPLFQKKIIAWMTFLPAGALATTIPFGFFATKSNKLVFTTTTQSVKAGICSGTVTVKSVNSVGATKTVSSDTTVTLNAVAGVTYYSDTNCATPVTSVTISSGQSTTNFYFLSTSTGTQTIAASATSYSTGSQNETITTNGFVWTGGGGNALWSTGANWSGGAAPGAGNVALFDGTCSSNCSATVSANISVSGIRVASGYSGTITQGSGVTVTLGSAGHFQTSGTFAGGNSSITVNGPYALVGGTFTSTSSNLRLNGTYTKVANSPTFNHANGKVELTAASGGSVSGISGISFYDVDVLGNGSSGTVSLTGTMNVLGTMRFVDFGYSTTLAGTGTINLSGSLETQGIGWKVNSTILIKMIGTGTITGSSTGPSYFGALEIATSGTITFATTAPIILTGDFTYTSGSVVTTGSTIKFIGSSQTITPGAMSFNHVNFTAGTLGGAGNHTINGTLKALGDLTFYCDSYTSVTNSGTIEVSGSLNIQGNHLTGGTTLVKMLGTGTITGSGSGSYIGPLEIAASGTITFANSGTIDIGGNFTYTSGTVVATGSTVRFVSASPVTVNSGSMVFNNLTFAQPMFGASTITGTVYVGGNLLLSTGGFLPSINGGTFDVKGNLTAQNSFSGGTASIVMSGTGVQTISISSGTPTFPGSTITVNNASSILTLGSSLSLGTSPGITVTSGSVDMAGYSLTTKTLSLNSNTLTKNGGVLKVNGTTVGTGPLYGGTVNP